jgi:hypothetical protein
MEFPAAGTYDLEISATGFRKRIVRGIGHYLRIRYGLSPLTGVVFVVSGAVEELPPSSVAVADATIELFNGGAHRCDYFFCYARELSPERE